jgi:hypothetical protein
MIGLAVLLALAGGRSRPRRLTRSNPPTSQRNERRDPLPSTTVTGSPSTARPGTARPRCCSCWARWIAGRRAVCCSTATTSSPPAIDSDLCPADRLRLPDLQPAAHTDRPHRPPARTSRPPWCLPGSKPQSAGAVPRMRSTSWVSGIGRTASPPNYPVASSSASRSSARWSSNRRPTRCPVDRAGLTEPEARDR